MENKVKVWIARDKDNELSGREYERVVKYVESILKDRK